MKEVSQKNFGLLIAYVVPGLVALWGVSYFSETVRMWLTTANESSPSVAGFLYVTLASLAAGLALDAIRSVTIDQFHHLTGVQTPNLDFSDFQAKFWAFNQIVESHYRHYQAYAHMCLAVPALLTARLVASGEELNMWLIACCLILELVLLVVSRETLKTYYTRASHLLGTEKRSSLPAIGKPATKASKNGRSNEPEPVSHTSSPGKTAEQVDDGPEPRKVARW